MTDYKILTDSTADLPLDYLKDEDIKTFHLSYTIDGETYGGLKEELDVYKFYELMREGKMPITSQVNPEEAKQGLLNAMQDGTKKIIYIAFSSALSGTFNSVRIAAGEIMEENKAASITVIDSKCASLGEGLFVYKVNELKKKGKSYEEVCEWAKENATKVVHLFTVDDLNHLFRGGRVSKSTAFLGTVLNIKPVLHVDNEGRLIALGKERGRKKSLLKLVDMMEDQQGSFGGKNDIVFISHGDCIEDAEFVKEEISKRFGINKFIINHVGPTIGAHSGPGTIALFFMGDIR